MSMDCEMLGALLSERRRGELSGPQAQALQAHLSGCPRCSAEARGLESVLERVELPPIGPDELEALRRRRVGSSPPALDRRAGWRFPAVLVAAAAAAVLTVSVGRAPRPHPAPTGAGSSVAVVPLETETELAVAADSQELFPEMTPGVTDDAAATIEDDVALLEGPGLFGSIDEQEL